MSCLTAIRCACGSPDVVAIDPGAEPVRAPGGILIEQGRPATARCLACWPMAPGVQQDLFGRARR
jgi:hypothetical protein